MKKNTRSILISLLLFMAVLSTAHAATKTWDEPYDAAQIWFPAVNQCINGAIPKGKPVELQKCDTTRNPGQYISLVPSSHAGGDGWFELRNNQGECLISSRYEPHDGNHAHFWDCDVTRAIQNWRITDAGGVLLIENFSNRKCLIYDEKKKTLVFAPCDKNQASQQVKKGQQLVSKAYSPPFNQGVSLPQCDTFWKSIQNGIETALDSTVVYAANQTWKHALKPGFDYAAQGLAYASTITMVGVGELVGGDVKRFTRDAQRATVKAFSEGARATSGFAEDVGSMTYESALATVNSIGGDTWGLLSKITNPEAFGKKFFELNQQWNPAVSWSYMVSEGDLLAGMQKSALAFKKQAEAYSSIMGASNITKGIAKTVVKRNFSHHFTAALMDYAMADAEKNVLPGLASEADRQAYRLMMKNVKAQAMADFIPDPANHPMYKHTVLKSVPAKRVWNDYRSGGHHDWAVWQRDLSSPKHKNCLSFGDVMQNNHHALNFPGEKRNHLSTLCGTGVAKGKGVWWERPEDYRLFWSDKCTGSKQDMSLWKPICPTGYVGVGFVADPQPGDRRKPSPTRIACIKDDPSILATRKGSDMDSLTKKPIVAIDDTGTGAKFDTTIMQREFMGTQIMHVYPRYGVNALNEYFKTAYSKDEIKQFSQRKKEEREAKKALKRREAELKVAAAEAEKPYPFSVEIDGLCLIDGDIDKGIPIVTSTACKERKQGKQHLLNYSVDERGIAEIRSQDGRCLTSSEHSPEVGKHLFMYRCENNLSQKWRAHHLGNKQIALQQQHGDKHCIHRDGERLILNHCKPKQDKQQKLKVTYGVFPTSVKGWK